MALVNRTHVQVLYEGTDISRDVSKDLLSLTYTDNEGGKSDDLSLKLKNDHGRWNRAWYPEEGATIEATIIKETDEGTERLSVGRLTIDEIEVMGAPSTIDIRGVSVPINNTIRRTAKSRAWENVRLSEIAADVAGTGELSLEFLAPTDPLYDRRDQHDETDLQFLQRLATDEGYRLKVTNQQLVLYDITEQQGSSTIDTYNLYQGRVLSYSLKSQAHTVYKTATVEYKDPDTGEVNTYTYTDPNVQAGGEFKIVKRAESIAEAERMARAELQNANRLKVSGTLTVLGSVKLVSGVTIDLAGFGRYNGKYYVNTAEHSVSSGHTVRLEINLVEGA